MNKNDQEAQALNGLSGAPAMGSLRDAVERLAKETPEYLVEYGPRLDDGAMVYHFYPARGDTWNPKYRMRDRLQFAADKHLSSYEVKADYIPEMESFCLIVENAGMVPDPYAAASSFFSSIDAAF